MSHGHESTRRAGQGRHGEPCRARAHRNRYHVRLLTRSRNPRSHAVLALVSSLAFLVLLRAQSAEGAAPVVTKADIECLDGERIRVTVSGEDVDGNLIYLQGNVRRYADSASCLAQGILEAGPSRLLFSEFEKRVRETRSDEGGCIAGKWYRVSGFAGDNDRDSADGRSDPNICCQCNARRQFIPTLSRSALIGLVLLLLATGAFVILRSRTPEAARTR